MVGKHQAQAETDIRQAKILNDLLEKLTKNFTTLNKNAMHMAEVFKTASEKTTQIKDKLSGDRSHERHLIKQLGIEKEALDIKMKGLKEDREEQGRQKESRNRNRLDEIRTQGENVRHNLKMRQLYKDQGQSLSNVMNLMTGMSGKGAAMGGISTVFNTLSLGSNILETNKNLKDAKLEHEYFTSSFGKAGFQGNKEDYKGEMKRLKERVDRLTAVLTEQREKLGIFGKFGGAGVDDSKWAKRLEPIMTWAKKNKTGIIISAASIGMMFMVFKKLLSVSPMLQKMLEVMSLAFNLILRPFGDFIGFILRPIAMGFLMMVMPFFKTAYPMMMKLGTTIGDALANWKFGDAITAVLETFPPMQMITAIGEKLGLVPDGSVSDEDSDKAGVLLAGGAILAAAGGTLAAPYGTYRATKFGFNKIFGGGTQSGNVGGGSSTSIKDAVNALKKIEINSKLLRLGSALKTGFNIASKVALPLTAINMASDLLSPIAGGAYTEDIEFATKREQILSQGNGLDSFGMMGQDFWSAITGQPNGLDTPLYPNIIGTGFNGIATQTENGGTNITFNIDKVEKGVDVNMIALQVKSILETNDRYVTS